MLLKKLTGRYSAERAALGGRTIKTGQSRWFVGYKKHTLRLWLNQHAGRVLLIPIISWAVPANRGEALFLWPSLHYCSQRLNWLPDIVVGDMGYISLEVQRKIRERWRVTVLTKLRPDMNLVAPFQPGPVAMCPQGQIDLVRFGSTGPTALVRRDGSRSFVPEVLGA